MADLNPSKRVKLLRQELYTKKMRDRRRIDDALRVIQRETISLETQLNNARVHNQNLVHQANQGKEDAEVPF